MVLDKTRIAESDQSNLAYIERAVMNEMRCATLCKVTSVNSSNYTLTCLPLVKEKIRANNDRGYDYISLPELINVPYFTSSVISPQAGDMCICIHLDRGISDILKQDIDDLVQVNCNNNRHDITDCVALVGFGKLSQSALQYVTTNTNQDVYGQKTFRDKTSVLANFNVDIDDESVFEVSRDEDYQYFVDIGSTNISPTLRVCGDAGTRGQVLTSRGVGASPTWSDAPKIVNISLTEGEIERLTSGGKGCFYIRIVGRSLSDLLQIIDAEQTVLFEWSEQGLFDDASFTLEIVRSYNSSLVYATLDVQGERYYKIYNYSDVEMQPLYVGSMSERYSVNMNGVAVVFEEIR